MYNSTKQTASAPWLPSRWREKEGVWRLINSDVRLGLGLYWRPIQAAHAYQVHVLVVLLPVSAAVVGVSGAVI